ncbi:MAG: calcium/sodium antiporter [Pseudomonadota bacterium]
MIAWLTVAVALAVLTLGAELLVRGASAIARRAGLSELLIGLTLVGFGTSTPELVTSIEAAMRGAPGIALGNVVGSNIANILLILGLSAALAPIAVEPGAFRRDAPALAFATIACIAAALAGSFGRTIGAAFLLGLAAYLYIAYRTERRAPEAAETKRHEAEAAALPSAESGIAIAMGLSLSGLALLMVGAKLLVGAAVEIATGFGVSEAIIGLTIVAVGTSLPELAASLAAARRGKSALALGNVVGSNIYNILGILGATALTAPFAAPARILVVDIWVMLAATAALIVFAISGRRLSRLEGGILVAGYAAYLVSLGASL